MFQGPLFGTILTYIDRFLTGLIDDFNHNLNKIIYSA